MKKTSFSLPLIAVLLVGAGYLLIRTGDAAVEISQAQAAIEAARAAQSAAEAAQIASQGLSTVSTIQAINLLAIVGAVIGLIATVIYLLWDRRTRNIQLNDLLASRKRRWMPGPNAGYRELDPIPSVSNWKERRSGGVEKAYAKTGIDRVGRHLRTARLWPAWLRRAWPQAEIWTGWSEVTIGRLRRPDALSWGRLNGVETLFWLEVERMHRSRAETKERLANRHNRALLYAHTFPVHLVFVVLSQAWLSGVVIEGFQNLPNSTAVVLAEWKDFGSLPVPVWGRLVK